MGIGVSCLRASLTKSCTEKISSSCTSQLEILNRAGFSQSVIGKIILTLIKGAKSDWGKREKENKGENPVVIPYMHKTSHGLQHVATRYDVDIVFSALNKLPKLCGQIDRMLSPSEKPLRKKASQVNHTSPLCVVQRVWFIWYRWRVATLMEDKLGDV